MAVSQASANRRADADDGVLLERLAARLSAAVETDPELAGRLALADTTVELRSPSVADMALTAELVRERMAFTWGPPRGRAEGAVFMQGAQLRRLSSGRVSLPLALLRGEASYSGEVRSFLRVAPIVRRLLAERAAPEREPEPCPDASPLGEVPAALCAIECRDVHKRFGANAVLDGVDLGIPEGAITVVLGPSGTGKSVLLKHIIGLLFPDSGEVRIHGRSLSELTLGELLTLRRRLGILFQDGALFSSMSLFDNVAFPLRRHTDLDESEIATVVRGRLADVGLAGSEARLPSELSGGMRKRAGLARAMVFEPEIVLFDEPDSGLDPVRTALLCDLILDLHAKYGGTYVVITHDIATVRRISDYLAVLWNGRIVDAGPAEQMFQSADPFVSQFLAAAVDGPLGMD